MTDKAHHSPDGSFRNPWPDSRVPGWRDILRMATERRKPERERTPARGTFPVATPAISYPRASAGDYSATWLGHSTALLQFGGLNVLTDPVFSQRASPVQWLGPRRVMDPALPLDSLPPLDVVLLSHNHYDHLDKHAVRQIARVHPQATWVVPLKVGATVRDWGAEHIVELDWRQQVELSGARVTATPARHFSGRSFNDRYRSLWCGYALDVGGHRAYFAGDTAYHPEFGEIAARHGPFDFVIIPIGAYDPRWFMRYVHVDPEEAVRIYQELAAPHAGAPLPLMLSVHWGTFRLTNEPMDEPPRRAAERWRAAGLAAERLWVAKFGETRRVVR